MVLAILGFQACVSQVPDKGKFKYVDLEVFQIDTLEWEERIKHYNPLDSISHFQIFQDSSLTYYARPDHEPDQDFFYSWQVTKRDLYELTVLSQREGQYCERIMYFVYDSKGKLAGKFRVAGRCADGGFYETAHGRFVNDSTYVLKVEDNYRAGDDGRTITFFEEKTVIRPNGELVRMTPVRRTETRPNK